MTDPIELAEILDRLPAIERVALLGLLPFGLDRAPRHTTEWITEHGREPRHVRQMIWGTAFPYVTFRRWLPETDTERCRSVVLPPVMVPPSFMAAIQVDGGET